MRITSVLILIVPAILAPFTAGYCQPLEYQKCIQRGVHSNADIEACQRLDPGSLGAQLLGPDPAFTSSASRGVLFVSLASLEIVKVCAARNIIYTSEDVVRFEDTLDSYANTNNVDKQLTDRMRQYLGGVARQSNITNNDCNTVGNNIKAAFPDLFANKVPTQPSPQAYARPRSELAPATEASQTTLAMISIYSIAKLCANTHVRFTSEMIQYMEESIKNYINDNKVDKQVVDKIWSYTQNFLQTKQLTENDCAGLESNFRAVFPGFASKNIEENPFSK